MTDIEAQKFDTKMSQRAANTAKLNAETANLLAGAGQRRINTFLAAALQQLSLAPLPPSCGCPSHRRQGEQSPRGGRFTAFTSHPAS